MQAGTEKNKAAEVGLGKARQVRDYLQAQRVYVALLERYNPSLGFQEEDRIRLTARRVGFEMPTEGGR